MSDTSFGLGTCYHLERLISIDQQFFEDDISLIVDRFPSIKCLSITKNLVNAKLLVADQLLADGKPLVVSKHLVNINILSVCKHLVDIKHLTSMKMLTDLTYLTKMPDLIIYENSNGLHF